MEIEGQVFQTQEIISVRQIKVSKLFYKILDSREDTTYMG